MTTTAAFIVLCGLFGIGLTSTEEMEINLDGELRISDGTDDFAIFYREAIQKMSEIKKSRQIISPIGKNDFELVTYNTTMGHLESPERLVLRVKRSFYAPECNADQQDPVGSNDFESGTTPRSFIKSSWNWLKGKFWSRGDGDSEVKEFTRMTPFPPEKCFNEKKIEALDALATEDSLSNDEMQYPDEYEHEPDDTQYQDHGEMTQRTKKARATKRKKVTKRTEVTRKKKQKKRGKKRKFKLVKVKPGRFIKSIHSSVFGQRNDFSCGCEFALKKIGCSCCFYWEGGNVHICAGCGFRLKEAEFFFRLTLEDFKLFEYKKEVGKEALKKKLKLLSKSLCIPHQFSGILTACIEISIRFDPDFPQFRTPKISLCVDIVAQALWSYNFVLLELPCWVLEIPIPGNGERIVGRPGFFDKARLTYEGGLMRLEHPVKRMYAVKNILEVSKIIREFGDMERNETRSRQLPRYVSSHDGRRIPAVVVARAGEKPAVLKTGTPTKPINWEPMGTEKLQHMVVLYTQPLASPLSPNDDWADIPGFQEMNRDGLSRRFKDPSLLNLKVHASMATSCGGVILGPNKILTLCACIRSFYLKHKYNKVDPPVDDSPFNLLSSDIYVTYADRNFNADQTIYELDQDVDNFMKKSKCFDAIEREADKNIIQKLMVVMPVTPKFKRFPNITMVPWSDAARSAPNPVGMDIIGMKKRKEMMIYNASGYEFNPLYETVKVPYVSCAMTQYCSKGLNPAGSGRSVPKEFHDNTQCFCAQDHNFQLCDGTVSFPVITSDGLVGLNSIPMNCQEDGSMVASVFSQDIIDEINRYVSPESSALHSAGSALTAILIMPLTSAVFLFKHFA